jgi:hypothetical protein
LYLAHGQPILLCCCPRALPYYRAVGTYKDLRAAIRERDLAVLAVHGRKDRNPAAPVTLLPVSSYSDQEVAATAAELLQRVRGAGRTRLQPLAVHGLGSAQAACCGATSVTI